MTLYEKDAKCGGHTLTDESPGYPVDLGFQVLVHSQELAKLCAAAETCRLLASSDIKERMVNAGKAYCGLFCQ